MVNLIYHPVTAPSFFSFILDQDFMAQKKTWAYEQVDGPNVGKHKQASLTGHWLKRLKPIDSNCTSYKEKRRNCVQMKNILSVCGDFDLNTFCHIPSLFSWAFPHLLSQHWGCFCIILSCMLLTVFKIWFSMFPSAKQPQVCNLMVSKNIDRPQDLKSWNNIRNYLV